MNLTYSLIIPAYNEEGYLPRLLDTVDLARKRFRGGADAIEVIVADNASTDATQEIALNRGCLVASVEKRVIATARNGGAAIATGDVLCFTDADMQIHEETFNQIDDRMRSGEFIGGATGFRAERMSVGLFCTLAYMQLSTMLQRISAGVVFCDAKAFREIRGYNEERFFAEDMEFFKSMRHLGKKQGLKTVFRTHSPAVVSTRKFDKHGDWHMLWMLWWIPFRYGSFDNLVQAYWYDDNERF